MKRIIIKFTLAVALLSAVMVSCTKKLDLFPVNDFTSEKAYATADGYRQVLAKVYAVLSTTGSFGPGSGDIAGINAGFSDFFRMLWKAQELTTDEAIIAWGDPGIQDFHNMNWTTNNDFLRGLYLRCLYHITLTNEYLRQATDTRLSARGIGGADADAIRATRAEVRFIRAYQYYNLMDLYGNVPFVTEATPIGSGFPSQIARAELFNYIEGELLAIESELPAPRAAEFGRVDRAAAWALLARLYLNAGVYTGTNKYTEAITFSKRVIDAGYSLIPDYRHLMLADNQLNTSEFIFAIQYDGIKTQTFGGTTFLTHAAVGGDMSAANFGIDFGWGGIRTTRAFVEKFPDNSGFTDRRAQFFISGQNLDISDVSRFKDGFAITKFRNVTRGGQPGSNPTHVDSDMPIFRLAEQYFIYAEAVLRGGSGGSTTDALNYMNIIRTRAFGNPSGNIAAGDLTLQWILDERSRELYWEGHRRSDLIRYNQFVEGTYLWPWKGGVAPGRAMPAFLKLFPLPATDLQVNRNLVQNPGY
jgi:hypothetical protein